MAQAWIAQREATDVDVMEHHGMIPNGQDLPPPVPQMEPVPNNHNFQGDPNFNRMWQPGTFLTRICLCVPTLKVVFLCICDLH